MMWKSYGKSECLSLKFFENKLNSSILLKIKEWRNKCNLLLFQFNYKMCVDFMNLIVS